MPQMIPSKKFIATEKKPIEFFQREIPIAFNTACENFGYSDPESMTQSNFNACLMYISESVIQKYCLKKPVTETVYANSSYDIELLNGLLDIYIGLCYRYSKMISVYGYCLMCNIQSYVLTQWEIDKAKSATPEYKRFLKKLEQAAEESKRSLLIEKGRNPVGVLALLNHDNGYNLPGVSKETAAPRLSAREIREKMGLLSDKSGSDTDTP